MSTAVFIFGICAVLTMLGGVTIYAGVAGTGFSMTAAIIAAIAVWWTRA